ncbi:PfkB family carbohydrate kinase [Curtobacterium sp. MCPF17_052]|uniref:PfkB family carbohydrate kinase n=1 Tax=Curtobacterium sp. MCPF17_052 TaxID=2175655 RepID=UPI0024E03B2E|nr:PfkB family carbohydrate kinase [Curtobacterium sp. MCPF17_052]WIB12649.1 PfkB family carbohydrate kinase [Curtobacterium sp. MCPF17_052]
MTADVRMVRRVVDTIAARQPVVVVVGDVILDRWTVGAAERVSREAPAPVVRVTETIAVPGGAANTAVNARALGADVRMVALIGDDETGRVLRDRLEAAGVDTRWLVAVPGATTTSKDRIVGGDRVVVRVDDLAGPPSAADTALLAEATAAAVQGRFPGTPRHHRRSRRSRRRGRRRGLRLRPRRRRRRDRPRPRAGPADHRGRRRARPRALACPAAGPRHAERRGRQPHCSAATSARVPDVPRPSSPLGKRSSRSPVRGTPS